MQSTIFKHRLSAFPLLFCLLCAQAVAAQKDDQEADQDAGQEAAQPVLAGLPEVAWTMVPVIRSARISPNGKELMLLRAASKEGPYVVEIRQTDDLQAEPIRFGGGKTSILSAQWAQDGYLVISAGKDVKVGNRFERETRQAVIRSDGKGDWLDIDPDRSVRILSVLPDEPNRILISTDNNDNDIPDIVSFNIKTGAKRTVHRGSERVPGGFEIDFDGEVRLASAYDPSKNAFNVWARKKGEKEWLEVYIIDPTQGRENYSFFPLDFDRDNPNSLIVSYTNGEDTAGIYLMDLDTMQFSAPLFSHPRYDVDTVILSQKKADRGRILGFGYTGKVYKRVFIDEATKALYDGIQANFPGQEIYLDRSEDDQAIVISTTSAKNPGRYYLLRNQSELIFLGARMPLLTEEVLAEVKYVSYTARDGRKIRSYITLPTSGQAPYPAVVMPHGGPWVRDDGGYDEWAQLLANAGYVVIQPQYRGSRGFGLEHWRAGDEKWGLEMQDDVDDAAHFLVERGLADPARIAIHGFSYGGYSAFVASFRGGNNPFACSIAGAGVSDLDSLGAEFSDNRFLRELQKPTIKGLNPVDHIAEVHMPILVMHGDRDEIVHPKHSRWFVDGLKKYNKEHKYIEIEDMRHGPRDMEHKEIYYRNLLDWLENRCFDKQIAAN